MKLRNIFIILGIFIEGLFCVGAQTTPAAKKMDAHKLLFAQLSQSDPGYETFMENLGMANKAPVPDNFILSFQIFYQLSNQYNDSLADLLKQPHFSSSQCNFDAFSYFIYSPDDLKALEDATLVRMANAVNDMDSFESNVKESFWNGSPRLSAALIRWREALKTQGADAASLAAKSTVKEVKHSAVPFDVQIEYTHGGKTTFAKLTKGKKAILLDFWAPWCGPCIALLPQLIKRAEVLESQGIVVAGMVTDDCGKAEKIRRDKNIKLPWLIETDSQLYSRLFDIKSIPCMLLISQEGEVLFNGHPQDEDLKKALSSLDVTL